MGIIMLKRIILRFTALQDRMGRSEEFPQVMEACCGEEKNATIFHFDAKAGNSSLRIYIKVEV